MLGSVRSSLQLPNGSQRRIGQCEDRYGDLLICMTNSYSYHFDYNYDYHHHYRDHRHHMIVGYGGMIN